MARGAWLGNAALRVVVVMRESMGYIFRCAVFKLSEHLSL